MINIITEILLVTLIVDYGINIGLMIIILITCEIIKKEYGIYHVKNWSLKS